MFTCCVRDCRQHQVHNEAGSYPDLWLPVGLGPLAAPQIPMASITICRDTQEPCVGSVTTSREGVSGSAQGEAADAPARQRTPWIYSKWCWVQRRAAERPCGRATVRQCLCITASRATVQQSLCITASRATVQQSLCITASRATVQQCLCITASRATVQQCLCITASRATVQQCLCSPHAAEQPYSRAHASPQAEQLCSSACASSCSRATVLVQPAPCSRAMQHHTAPCSRAAWAVQHHAEEQQSLCIITQQNSMDCTAPCSRATVLVQPVPCSRAHAAPRSEQPGLSSTVPRLPCPAEPQVLRLFF
nr:uncharacterized protein LOC110363639 [Columba livia]